MRVSAAGSNVAGAVTKQVSLAGTATPLKVRLVLFEAVRRYRRSGAKLALKAFVLYVPLGAVSWIATRAASEKVVFAVGLLVLGCGWWILQSIHALECRQEEVESDPLPEAETLRAVRDRWRSLAGAFLIAVGELFAWALFASLFVRQSLDTRSQESLYPAILAFALFLVLLATWWLLPSLIMRGGLRALPAVRRSIRLAAENVVPFAELSLLTLAIGWGAYFAVAFAMQDRFGESGGVELVTDLLADAVTTPFLVLIWAAVYTRVCPPGAEGGERALPVVQPATPNS